MTGADSVRFAPRMSPLPARIFWTAAIYGFIAILPQFFLEGKLAADTGRALSHPEYYYGFFGVALAWQFAFVLIARDPIHYRPMMPFGALEKVAFGAACLILVSQGRAQGWQVIAAGVIDLIFAALILLAWTKTPTRAGQG